MIDIIVDDDVNLCLPDEKDIARAIQISCRTALQINDDVDLCVRFASDQAVQELNAKWRNKNKVTDVLSFPMQEGGIDINESLGDIVLAAEFVAGEARRLDVDVSAHVLHLIIHAVLHLLGLDHIEDDEACEMQQYESHIMKTLDLHNPYPTLEGS